MNVISGGGYGYYNGPPKLKHGKLKQLKEFLANLWLKKSVKIIVLAVGISLFILTLVQIAWPVGRSRPLSKTAGYGVGVASSGQIEAKLKKVDSQAVFQLKMGEKVVDNKFSTVGISIDVPATAKKIVYYPPWQRFIPFTLFMGSKNAKPVAVVDNQNLNELAGEWSKSAYVPAKNANIKIIGTKAEIIKSEPGKSFKIEDIAKLIQKAKPSRNTTNVAVKPQKVDPERHEDSLAKLLKSTQQSIDNPLALSVNNKTVVAPSTTIATWIKFTESQDKKTLSLDINQTKLDEFLNPLQKDVYKQPGTTVVSVVDGNEASRQVGSDGRGLDIAKSTESLKKALLNHDKDPVTLTVGTLAPLVKYNKTYTKTSRGLTALLNDIVKQKGDYAITVSELGGYGRYGSANGSKKYHPASTYKLYVAYSVLKRIESDELKWEDVAVNGKNIDQCFEVMIVNSDNACAEWFGDKISWGAVQADSRAVGLSSTSLLNSNGFQSTTDDQVRFLAKIQDESILKKENNEKLLSAMKRQVYRAGITSGTGAVVADKVGFLGGLLHDSGIVYSISGTYIISVYSNGSTWADIADAARQIQNYLSS